jgi:hypothetical protein
MKINENLWFLGEKTASWVKVGDSLVIVYNKLKPDIHEFKVLLDD